MKRSRPLWLIGYFVIIFSVAGCALAGGKNLEQTPVPRELPTETPFPTSTPTEEPTPIVEAALETEEVGVNLDDLEGTLIAQAEEDFGFEELAPDLATATAMIQEATQEKINLTLSAEAFFDLQTPSATPEVFLPPETATPEPFVPAPGADCVHEVRAGENLFRLSLNYGVPLRDIANRSGVTNINFIVVGQRLTIPGCGTTGVVPPPTSVPNTGGTSAGGIDGGTGGSFAGGLTHVVDQNETLFEISLRYNVPVRAIAAANGLSNINLIYIDQVLTIP